MEEAKNEAEKRSLNFQKQNLELQKQNSELQEEKWKLTQHLKDLRSDSKATNRTLNQKIEELNTTKTTLNERIEILNEEVNQLKSEGMNPSKKQKVATGRINPKGISLLANTKAVVLENYNLLIKAIEKNDKETCKKILDKAQNKNQKYEFGWTTLQEAAYSRNCQDDLSCG